MSNNNQNDNNGAALVIFFIIAAVVIGIVIVSISIGAFYGSGKAVYNYGRAFTRNVSLEKVQQTGF